ncbi:unnamed protein product [Porites lobata]|uniref:Uncharacterized protein n=1 Tax=Porites lobata TaxID=104759 RepID=A0ABN8P359_9CNID|nr:unnamed protein product [Porites lobata]
MQDNFFKLLENIQASVSRIEERLITSSDVSNLERHLEVLDREIRFLNAIIPECETSAKGSAEPEGGNKDLSTIDYNTLNVLHEESQTTKTQEAAPQEVSEQLISTCVTPTRVKTIQRVLTQQDAKRHLCALRLLTHFFIKEELAESNTDGSHDKRGLDSGKLNSRKILVFSKFPASNSEEKAKAWRVIKGKINSQVSSCPQIFKDARFYSTFIIISLMCAF